MYTGPPIITDISSGIGITTAEPNVRHVRVLLSPMLQEGLEDFAIGHTVMPPYQHGKKHNHPEGAEVWMFVSGKGHAVLDNQKIDVSAGSIVYTPTGTSHQFINTGDEEVKIYFLYIPSGPERSIIEGKFR